MADRTVPDHACSVCGIGCSFGVLGPSDYKWYCRKHVPADFFPAGREVDGRRHALPADSASGPVIKPAAVVKTPKPSETGDLF